MARELTILGRAVKGCLNRLAVDNGRCPQFDIAQSEAVELNVKSNHPKFPVIKVPIVRPVRPVPVAVPAPGQMTQPPVRAGAGG